MTETEQPAPTNQKQEPIKREDLIQPFRLAYDLIKFLKEIKPRQGLEDTAKINPYESSELINLREQPSELPEKVSAK